MNPEKLQAGLDALVRLYAHARTVTGGPGNVFVDQARCAAAFEVTEAYYAGLVELVPRVVEGDGPADPSAPKTERPSLNVYDDPPVAAKTLDSSETGAKPSDGGATEDRLQRASLAPADAPESGPSFHNLAEEE